MKLRSLQLENICQHERLRFDFETGLIGIYGPNGSGKSNAMNVACYAGLTNDYSRHHLKKQGMIRQQADPEASSSILVEFEHDGERFSILRGLRNPECHIMKRPGRPSLTKASEIQHELENVLGVKRNLIDDYIFVEQWGLFAFLSATAAERAKSFSHLCRTTHAERCWQILGDQIAADTPLANSIVDTSDEVRKRISEYRAKIRQEKESLVAARKELLTKTAAERYKAILKQQEEREKLQETIEKLRKRLLKAKKEAKAAHEALRKAKEAEADYVEAVEDSKRKLEKLTNRLKQEKPKASEAKTRLARISQVKKRLQAKERLENRLAELREAYNGLSRPEDPGFDFKELEQERKELELKLLQAERLVESFEDGQAECPVCGTPVSSLEEHLKEARESIPDLRGRVDELAREIQECLAYKQAMLEYRNKKKSLTEQIAEKETDLEAYEDVEPVDDEDIEQLRTTIRTFEVLEEDVEDAAHQLDAHEEALDDTKKVTARAKNDYTAKKTLRDEIKQNLQEAEEKLAASELDQAELKEAEAALSRHQAAQTAITKAKARISSLEEFIEERNEELKEIKRRLARSKRARKWVKLMTYVRDEVMHRDKLPRLVHQSYLNSMVEEVNATLADFEAPFWVEASEDIGFTAHFHNGTVMPAPGLSGGQKVVLALAFRLTVNSIFAPQLGTMVLDEPTDGLDADNRRLAAEFFSQLGQIAKSRGLQVIVITHDDELERMFDQKFVLERPF